MVPTPIDVDAQHLQKPYFPPFSCLHCTLTGAGNSAEGYEGEDQATTKLTKRGVKRGAPSSRSDGEGGDGGAAKKRPKATGGGVGVAKKRPKATVAPAGGKTKKVTGPAAAAKAQQQVKQEEADAAIKSMKAQIREPKRGLLHLPYVLPSAESKAEASDTVDTHSTPGSSHGEDAAAVVDARLNALWREHSERVRRHRTLEEALVKKAEERRADSGSAENVERTRAEQAAAEAEAEAEADLARRIASNQAGPSW